MGKYLFTFLLLFSVFFNVVSQTDSDYDKLKEAFTNVQNTNYKEAYPYFEEMLRLYPKEPTYQYYAGVCLLHIEKDPNKYLPYLRYAATKNVPVDVYYYLGIAYLRNYQFEKSVESFEWFEKNADRKRMKESDFQNYKSMAQNGLYLTKYIQKPIVYSKEKQAIDDFYKSYTISGLEGYFIDKSEYFNEPDSLSDNSVLFIPDNGRERYFAQINEKRGDYDIYKIEQLSDTSWSEPENLGDVINTLFDENYPFLHFDGNTLYFASKGHYSMGGYDLYKSIWDWNEQTWSEPENLDFPVNSPYDDILFVASPNKRSAMFASMRETKQDQNQVMVYHVKLTNSEPYIEVENHQEIIQYAKLDVNATIQNENKQDVKAKYKTDQKELVKIKNDESFLHKLKYDSLLNQAISYQLKADSLRWIIDEKRSAFDVTKDGQERARLSNIIVELEREIYSLQKQADNCYAQVREIEQMNLASKKSIYEDAKKTEQVEDLKQEVDKVDYYFEPIPDSIDIAKLVIPEDTVEQDSTELLNWGLRVEIPSIYDESSPIPVNETLPDGIVYMIQLGAFSTEKSSSLFKGLTPLSVIKKENSKIRKYFVGRFSKLAEAEENLPLAQSKGFRDAYIVAFQDGEIIPVKNAVKLESGREIGTIIQKEIEEADTTNKIQPEIIFAIKGQFNPKDSLVVDTIQSVLSENLELYVENQKEISKFLIKSFGKYDQALPIKNKLDAILPDNTEIHAYFAENQIPLEQAIKITQ